MSDRQAVERGVALALEAHQRGWFDEQALSLILAYYDNEGARTPLPPQEVLRALGGLTPEQLAGLQGTGSAGRRFTDRLTLLDLLGEGGMGSVYRGYDRVLRRTVAVKLIRPDRLGSDEVRKHLARFEREAQAMAKIRHPACVSIFDAGFSSEGYPYLVMEYVAGSTLAGLIAESPEPLDAKRVAQIGKQVADGLQACHEAGFVHRDVKPANILLDVDGHPKITDFGIAFDGQARTRLTVEASAVGTLAYLPPEQAGGEITDARSDVYALGATLYEALCGRTVFEGQVALAMLQKIVGEEPRSPRVHRPDLPADLELVVLKCLEKEPQDRYPSAQALALDLARFLVGEPVEARPLGWGARFGRRAWRQRRLLAVALVLFVLLGIGWIGWGWNAERALRAGAAAGLAEAESLIALAQDPSAPGRGDLEARLTASEGRVSKLEGSALADVARDARGLARQLRGCRWLIQADEALAKCLAVPARREALSAEQLRLKEEVKPGVPPSESEAKRRLVAVEREFDLLENEGGEAFVTTDRLLAQATVDLGERAVAGRKARLYLARGRELEEFDPVAAEAYLAPAARADALAGGDLADQLRLPRLSVSSEPSAGFELLKYGYDPSRGHQVPVLVARRDGPATLQGLVPGEYLLRFAYPGHMPVRRPVLLLRGHSRDLSFELIASETLGWLADSLIHVTGGSARVGLSYPRVEIDLDAFLIKRFETTNEEWLSFLIGAQPGRERVPGKWTQGFQFSSAQYPVVGISYGDVVAHRHWLQAELDLRGLPFDLDLPVTREFRWTLRGEFAWLFPWGRRYDPTLCAAAIRDTSAVGSVASDSSSFGVRDLASSVTELLRGAAGGRYTYSIGGSVHDAAVEALLRAQLTARLAVIRPHENEKTGFRYVLRPRGGEQPQLATRPTPPEGRVALERARRLLSSGSLDLDPVLGLQGLVEPRRMHEALALATKAVSADRELPLAWHLRAVARRHLGDAWGCLWDAYEAIKRDRTQPAFFFNRALAHLMRFDTESGMKDVEEGLRLAPESLDGVRIRGRILWQMGKHSEARLDLERFLREQPAHVAAADIRKLLQGGGK